MPQLFARVSSRVFTVSLFCAVPFLFGAPASLRAQATAQLQPDTAQHTLAPVQVVAAASGQGMGRLPDVGLEGVFAGKKSEVLLLDSLNASSSQNTNRQVLGKVPGLVVTETEGQGFPSNGIAFRGLNPSQSIEMNVRQNGYGITADLYGYPESYYIPPFEAVSRIELLRGAAALQYGPQLGGLINYVLREAPAAPFELHLQQTAGSYGFFNTYTSVGGTLGRLSYAAYGQYRSTAGWRPNSDLRQVSAFSRLQYRVSPRLTLGVEYTLLRNRMHMPGGLSDSTYALGAQQSFRARNWITTPWNVAALTAVWQLSPATRLSLRSTVLVAARDLVWRNEDGGPNAPDTISRATRQYIPRELGRESFFSTTTELRLQTNYSLAGQATTLAAGLRYFGGTMRRRGGAPGTTGSSFDLTQEGPYAYELNFATTNLALFAENLFRLSPKLAITPGARLEFVQSTAQGYRPNQDAAGQLAIAELRNRQFALLGLAIQYQTTANTQLYGTISQSYRPVDYSSITPLGTTSRVDPKLKDARAWQADLGYRGRLGRLSFEVSGFYLVYNDRIGLVARTDGAGNTFTLRTNLAQSVHKGVESYLELGRLPLRLGQANLGAITLFNSLAYIDARYTKGTADDGRPLQGNWVEYAPNAVERAGITYSWGPLSTTLQTSYTAQSYGDATNTRSSPDAVVGLIPAYQVWDLSAEARLGKGSAQAKATPKFILRAGVNNLGNRKYFTRRTDEYPGPGILPSAGSNFYVSLGAVLH